MITMVRLILAVAVGLIVLCAVASLEPINGNNGRSYWAIALSVVSILVNFFAPSLRRGTIWLAPIMFIAMLLVMACIANLFYWKHEQEGALRQALWMIVVLIPVTLTTESAAYMTASLVKNRTVISMIIALPFIMAVLSAIFFVVDAVWYRE